MFGSILKSAHLVSSKSAKGCSLPLKAEMGVHSLPSTSPLHHQLVVQAVNPEKCFRSGQPLKYFNLQTLLVPAQLDYDAHNNLLYFQSRCRIRDEMSRCVRRPPRARGEHSSQQ